MALDPNAELNYTKDEINASLEKASRSGLMYLLYSDEESGTGYANTDTGQTLNTYELPANDYNKIIIESEIQIHNSGIPYCDFELQIKEEGVERKQIIPIITAETTMVVSIKTVIDGGQSAAATIDIIGRMGTADVDISMVALSLRVYGIN